LQAHAPEINPGYQMLELVSPRPGRASSITIAHFMGNAMDAPARPRFVRFSHRPAAMPSSTLYKYALHAARAFGKLFAVPENNMLTRNSPLAFDVVHRDKPMLTTVGDASALYSDLSDEQREQHHWKVAIVTLGSALKEPRYLAAATLTLQTALALDAHAHPSQTQPQV
jgi:hypothetical protein